MSQGESSIRKATGFHFQDKVDLHRTFLIRIDAIPLLALPVPTKAGALVGLHTGGPEASAGIAP